MGIVLDEAEGAALRWALEKYLPELRYEAARVELGRDRQELVAKEELLARLLTRLPGG